VFFYILYFFKFIYDVFSEGSSIKFTHHSKSEIKMERKERIQDVTEFGYNEPMSPKHQQSIDPSHYNKIL
jgi:hypothetical protein